jgi:hypothetical protein
MVRRKDITILLDEDNRISIVGAGHLRFGKKESELLLNIIGDNGWEMVV